MSYIFGNVPRLEDPEVVEEAKLIAELNREYPFSPRAAKIRTKLVKLYVSIIEEKNPELLETQI